MPKQDELWTTWLEAHLWIERPGGDWWHLSPRPGGDVDEFPLASPVYLVTAYNPLGEELAAADNEHRQGDLLRFLDEQRIAAVRSMGVSADETWSEPGFALLDASEAEALALARSFEQAAIYAWSERRLEVIGALHEGRASVGWSLEDDPPPRS